MDATSAYMMSLTAMTLGMDCEFLRVAPRQSIKEGPISGTRSMPVVFNVTASGRSDRFWASVSLTKRSKQMAQLVRSKVHTRRALAAEGVPTPLGGLAWSENMKVLDAFEERGFRQVLIKPNTGSLGKGVLPHILIADARAHILENPDTTFIVEEFIHGTEFRIFVVGGEYSSSFAKLREHVVGNGKNTLQELFDAKMRLLLNNPVTRISTQNGSSKMAYLKKTGVDLGSVLEQGEFVWLSDDIIPSSNFGVFFPSHVTDEFKALAPAAAKCLGGDTLALDVFDDGAGKYFVLEANSKPGFSADCFPMNAPWNLRYPEAVLMNSFPNYKPKIRKIKRYDFIRLVEAFYNKSSVLRFDAKDFAEFE